MSIGLKGGLARILSFDASPPDSLRVESMVLRVREGKDQQREGMKPMCMLPPCLRKLTRR